MIRTSGFFCAVILAYCFAAVGDLLLQCRSTCLLAWNRSFLIGLTVSSVALVPLSWLLPGTALSAILLALLVAGILRLRSVFVGRISNPNFRLPHGSRWATLYLAVIVLAFMQFAVQDLRWSYLWDGYQIWATKAEILNHNGALSREFLDPHEAGVQRVLDYPSDIPLYDALVSRLRGSFELNALKPVFILFYGSLLVSTFHAARMLVPRTVAMAATALLSSVPYVSTHFSVGGYADMPQAALMAAVLAAIFERSMRRETPASAVPWLLGGVIFVKNEGTVLALIAFAAIVLYLLIRTPAKEYPRLLPRYRWEFIIFFLCFAVRKFFQAWMDVHDLTYMPVNEANLARAAHLFWSVLGQCLHYILDFWEWGVFWPAFAVSALILFAIGTLRERVLIVAILAALTAYTSIFYFTTWDIPLHIDQAYDRLLVQVSPAAAVAVAAAYARLTGLSEPESSRVESRINPHG